MRRLSLGLAVVAAVGLSSVWRTGRATSRAMPGCAARANDRAASFAARWPARPPPDLLRGMAVSAADGHSERRLALSSVMHGSRVLAGSAGQPFELKIETRAPGVTAVRIAARFVRGAPRSLRLEFPAAPGEHFYGTGERFFGPDLAGRRVDTWTQDRDADASKRTSYITTPFLLSSSGYGLYLATNARASFDIGASHPGCVLIDVRAASLQAYLIAGSNPKTVLERRARLIGRPPLPPRWGFGVWKTMIGGPGHVDAEAARLRALRIPIDVAWIYDAVDRKSGFGWRSKLYGPINRGHYPDLPASIARLHRRGLHVLGYLNPFLLSGSEAFTSAARRHYLVVDARGKPITQAWEQHQRRAYIDFTNRAASAWWQARVRGALTLTGFDGAMQDFGEDAPANGAYANGQPGALVHNRYPVLYARAVRRAAQAAKPGNTVFFARSGYTGAERYVTGGFTGDQARDWSPGSGIGSVVPALLSSGLSGRPYEGPDIAGFFESDTGPDQQLLWERWLEIGALSPTMRDMLGAFSTPIDLWSNRETTALFRRYARLHEALRPYIYRYAGIAHDTGLPIMRPLFLNYPSDPATYALNDEYLLGSDVLVAPVTRPRQTSRRVYLPAGRWREYWTNQTYDGARWITLPAPRDQIPLLIGQGAGAPTVRLARRH